MSNLLETFTLLVVLILSFGKLIDIFCCEYILIYYNLIIMIKKIDGLEAKYSPCGDWIPYKDEKCFLILDNTCRTFDDAINSCQALHVDKTGDNEQDNKPILPIIESQEEQDFLVNYLFGSSNQPRSNAFWLGARFNSLEHRYKWIGDNSDVNYTNWSGKGPRNKDGYCIEMEADESVRGKWIDELCSKENLVICQRTQIWPWTKIQSILLAQKTINDQLNKEMRELKQNIVPIGFIYTQLPNQIPPDQVWPWTKWTEVSEAYAGLFFRTSGGGDSAPFGTVQEANAPRVTEIQYMSSTTSSHNQIRLPVNGWSDRVYSGSDCDKATWYYLQFYTSGGEVRPRNMAVKIWKRIG